MRLKPEKTGLLASTALAALAAAYSIGDPARAYDNAQAARIASVSTAEVTSDRTMRNVPAPTPAFANGFETPRSFEEYAPVIAQNSTPSPNLFPPIGFDPTKDPSPHAPASTPAPQMNAAQPAPAAPAPQPGVYASDAYAPAAPVQAQPPASYPPPAAPAAPAAPYGGYQQHAPQPAAPAYGNRQAAPAYPPAPAYGQPAPYSAQPAPAATAQRYAPATRSHGGYAAQPHQPAPAYGRQVAPPAYSAPGYGTQMQHAPAYPQPGYGGQWPVQPGFAPGYGFGAPPAGWGQPAYPAMPYGYQPYGAHPGYGGYHGQAPAAPAPAYHPPAPAPVYPKRSDGTRWATGNDTFAAAPVRQGSSGVYAPINGFEWERNLPDAAYQAAAPQPVRRPAGPSAQPVRAPVTCSFHSGCVSVDRNVAQANSRVASRRGDRPAYGAQWSSAMFDTQSFYQGTNLR